MAGVLLKSTWIQDIRVYLKASKFLDLQGLELEEDLEGYEDLDYILGNIRISCLRSDEDNCPEEFFIDLYNFDDSIPEVLIPVVEKIEYCKKIKVLSKTRSKKRSYKIKEGPIYGYAEVRRLEDDFFIISFSTNTMDGFRALYDRVRKDFLFRYKKDFPFRESGRSKKIEIGHIKTA